MVFRLLTASALLAALGPAAATAAGQPTIDQLAPCYVAAQPTQTQPVSISAHGFVPYAHVDVYIDDVPQTPPGAAPQADAAGNVAGSVPAPFIQFGVHRFVLRLSEEGNAADTVMAASRVTALSVEQIPAQARTHARVRFRGRGFIAPGPVYAHYVFHGHARMTKVVAWPHGACGAFSRRMRQFPFRHGPRLGTWTIQFDQQREYTPTPEVSARLTVKVNRAISPGG
jgi:hypothetical protein